MTILDRQPSAADSYARTLASRGCPQHLAQAAADILANDGNRTKAEQAIVSRAWASISP